MKKIVVIGSSNMDVVIRVPHIPAPGETILATGLQYFPGGKGANQAVALARLGANVHMIGCVGEDDHGTALISCMKEDGVATEAVETVEQVPTGTAYINVSDRGENNIVVNPGANHCVSGELVTRWRHLLEGAAYCLVQLEIPLPTVYLIAKLCKEYAVRLILNPAPAADLDFKQLEGTWMIAPNESELNLLVPEGTDVRSKARILQQKGFDQVLVTLGEQGCLLVDAHGEKQYPAYTAISVADTTAAGDSFLGALAFGLSRDLPMEEAITIAAKAAACTVSRAGAQASLPTWEEVSRLP